LWYRQGLVDFYHYQNSDLHTIAQFHPAEFCYETDRKLLWQSVEEWQHIILIDWEEKHLDEIISMATHKRPDMQHRCQIINKELEKFQYLKTSLPSSIIVKWEDIIDQDRFPIMIKELSKKIKLDLDLDLLKIFWTQWKFYSNRYKI
jgi:hypothetical protein